MNQVDLMPLMAIRYMENEQKNQVDASFQAG